MAEIFIDGIKYTVPDGQNLLAAVLSLGMDLQYFCWHPAMGSVGACRQCAVIQYKDENDTIGKLVMACLTPATNGSRISINSVDAKTFRARVIEWLMTNHPHDCPVCDEGGECHLQDMTLQCAHVYRRYRFEKRTFQNQYLGPFIYHEMNRCIACYRCVRFYRDYAAGTDFDVFGAHNLVYFGRSQDGILESEFAGNLVEVCPTGVFTDRTFRHHYTRKWDLQSAPSICVHCGVGCNTTPGSRYGALRRIRNRYSYEINGYFLCDRGRFGHEFVENERRVRAPGLRSANNGPLEQVSADQALEKIFGILRGSRGIIGIGSPRATIESNFALKTLVGPDNFYTGSAKGEQARISEVIDILQNGPARSVSLREIREADAVLVLGEDLHNTAPMMALAVIQASKNEPMKKALNFKIPAWDDISVREVIQDRKGPIYIASPALTKLDSQARGTIRGTPDDIARFGYAIANAINTDSPKVTDLADDTEAIIKTIADELRTAERPIVISGISLNSKAVIEAAANIAWALCREGKNAGLAFVMPESNSLGIGLLGGGDLEAAFERAGSDEIDTAIILENDLYRRAGKTVVDKFFNGLKNVIVIDCLENESSLNADIILPAATFADGDGSLINYEGRLQRYFKVLSPSAEIRESWRWMAEIMRKKGDDGDWENLDDITDAMYNTIPVLRGRNRPAPKSDFRMAGMKLARNPHRYSGRTAEYADVTVHEPPPSPDPDSPFDFSMEGNHDLAPPGMIAEFWSPGWNSIQSLNYYQEVVGGPLKGGTAGVRLIEPLENARPDFFNRIPDGFQPRPGHFLLLPLHHIFGSEELSSRANSVSELIPEPYLALNPVDAEKFDSPRRANLRVEIGELILELPAKILEGIPEGMSGLPAGFDVIAGISLPVWGKVEMV